MDASEALPIIKDLLKRGPLKHSNRIEYYALPAAIKVGGLLWTRLTIGIRWLHFTSASTDVYQSVCVCVWARVSYFSLVEP
jgi:hypothetical protein